VLDFARSGFKEPQQLNFVFYLLGLGLKPDVVLNIDGFNEVALGCDNGASGSHPAYPSTQHWSNLVFWTTSDREALDRVIEMRTTQNALESWGDLFVKWRLERSCLLGKLALRRMYELRRTNLEQSEHYAQYLADTRNPTAMHGPSLKSASREDGTRATVEASVECWKQCSRSLSDICRARGIVYLHVLQPTLHDTGSKPLSAHEIEHGKASEAWITGVHLGYPRLREEGRELARLGVDFVDASMIFEKRSVDLYFDCCHFGNSGFELLTQTIAPELARRLSERLHELAKTLPETATPSPESATPVKDQR
jgi:hypothetical protein